MADKLNISQWFQKEGRYPHYDISRTNKKKAMRKDKNMDFVNCHSCNHKIDVSKQALIFEDNPEKQIIKKVCEKCSSISQLVISMVYGLTSIELINKRRNGTK